MKTYQKTLISVLIGLISFPVIALGSSFTVSLIQGKTPAEAVQILAEQMDILIGRVETVEVKQNEQEQITSDIQSIVNQQQNIIDQQRQTIENQQSLIDREKACRKANELLIEIKEACGITPFPGMDECITKRINWYTETNNPFEINSANRLKELKSQYLELRQNCNSLSQ